MSDDQLLDEVLTAEGDFNLESADLGLRFANYLIDNIALRILGYIIPFGTIAGFGFTAYMPLSIATLVYLSYFMILESIYGQTLGKMVTATKVVNEDGMKPNTGQLLLRALIRMIPIFDALSFFFYSDRRGWHDRWSRTYVVKNRY